MLTVPNPKTIETPTFPQILHRLAKSAALVLALAMAGRPAAAAETVAVEFQGTVLDQSGSPIVGATVKLLESALSATTDGLGNFLIKGAVANGIIRRTRLPGNVDLSYRNGILTLNGIGKGGIKSEWISPTGVIRALVLTPRGADRAQADLDALTGGASGVHWLRIRSQAGQTTFRFDKIAAGIHGILTGGAGTAPAPAYAGAGLSKSAIGGNARTALTTAPSQVFLLEAGASGFLAKRSAQSLAVASGLSLTLLPASASLKERIQDFIGAGNTLRLAFLKLEAPGSRKYILNYADFAEMAGDTMPQHAFVDSRGPDNSIYGAFGPSWSPDGRAIAYETGWENLTTPVSRVYIQPLGGPRKEGPVYPATNPRWWTDGGDTSLIWCSSGRQDGWSDTASTTYRQKVSADSLVGTPEVLAKGSYNAGLSPDGRYLATAFRYALMMDLTDKAKRYLHVYPGHPPARDGSSTDSLQACNGSISRDPAHPSRMLFLDFGVPDEPSYPNPVLPKLYAQHRMILIGDYASEAPGRIVDFIDTPPAELAKQHTWDDPEWTNQADYAVATTRDPEGDKTVPAEPVPTQPDIYLIKLGTKESIKVLSGTNQVLPVAWIGPKR